MTRRLYYDDARLTEFEARVVEALDEGRRLVLDQTAFYPASGGQPDDRGVISGVPVSGVVEEGERIVHVLSEPVIAGTVRCQVNWPRRFDHMQQHSGQHLLSAVMVELANAPTLSFHLGEEASTIDVGAASLDAAHVAAAERRANEIIQENRPVSVSYENAGEAADLRKPRERGGTLRIISIEGLDRSACGGTHVRATGEIGLLSIRKLDKIRGNVRIEFLCGMRAVCRARADFSALAEIARALSSPLDGAPALVAAQAEAAKDLDKALRRAAIELAQYKGKELYQATPPGADGVRRHRADIRQGPIPDDVRALAQSFTSQPMAVFLAACSEPPSLLLAASTDSGVHAGNALKAAVTAHGGRGGGSATLAQGSVPSVETLLACIKAL